MRLRNIPGAKEAVESSPYVVQEPEKWKGKWAEAFGRKAPLHIEVGMGKGRFLMEMARLHPEVNYIGIEMYASVLYRAVQKREEIEGGNGNQCGSGEVRKSAEAAENAEECKTCSDAQQEEDFTKDVPEAAEQQSCGDLQKKSLKLPNLLFIRVDATLLPDIFAPGEVDRIYLNFSDPWPKARHESRRLTSRRFLERYAQILSKDGIIEFKTDNRGLFDFSLAEAPAAGWTILESTFDLHHDEKMCQGNVMTEYEEKFSSIGNPICKMVICRTPRTF